MVEMLSTIVSIWLVVVPLIAVLSVMTIKLFRWVMRTIKG